MYFFNLPFETVLSTVRYCHHCFSNVCYKFTVCSSCNHYSHLPFMLLFLISLQIWYYHHFNHSFNFWIPRTANLICDTRLNLIFDLLYHIIGFDITGFIISSFTSFLFFYPSYYYLSNSFTASAIAPIIVTAAVSTAIVSFIVFTSILWFIYPGFSLIYFFITSIHSFLTSSSSHISFHNSFSLSFHLTFFVLFLSSYSS